MTTTGTILADRYRVDRMLTIDALEALYQGWDLVASTPVIIREFLPQQDMSPEILEQRQAAFHNEAARLLSLDHPHLVHTLAAFCEIPRETTQPTGQQLPHAYLIYPDLPGQSLASLLKREGAAQEERVRSWAVELLDVLTYLHDQGIIHRDIRPATIWITPDDRALLTHIEVSGLWDPRDPATWTAKRVMGTPHYAPPEQWDMRVGRIDARSDLFSLGATLYHAVTGERPLTAAERTANPYRFLQVRALRPHVSPSMEAVILKAIELTPARRFQSAQEMATALQSKHHRGLTVSPPPAPFLPQRKEIPWQRLLGLAVSVFVLVGAGLIGAMLNLAPPQHSSLMLPTSTELTEPSAITETGPAAMTPMGTSTVPNPPTAPPTQVLPALPGLTLTPPPSWRLVISETFSSNVNEWPVHASTDDWGGIERQVTDGVYRWIITATQPVARWATPDAPNSFIAAKDFLIQVDASRQEGPEQAAYGLVLRHKEGSYYLFSVRDDGFFQFSLWTGFSWQPLLDWTETTRVHPQGANALAVLAQGPQFDLYINGDFVATTEDTILSSGEFGLSVITPPTEGTAVFTFDNIQLWVP